MFCFAYGQIVFTAAVDPNVVVGTAGLLENNQERIFSRKGRLAPIMPSKFDKRNSIMGSETDFLICNRRLTTSLTVLTAGKRWRSSFLCHWSTPIEIHLDFRYVRLQSSSVTTA